jgi:coenzyme F420 hydrogenase subunit beta
MGCGACAWACTNKAITLENIHTKGIRPRVDENKCQQCQDCVSVCPGISLKHEAFQVNTIRELSEGWGPIIELYEGYASESNVRYSGSSGGIATALAIYAIEAKKYTGVLHIKSNPQNPLENIPTFSTSKQELLSTTGSRYSPAAPCQAFNRIKNAPGKCLFIGKPCDCVALRKAMLKDTDLKNKVGMIFSIFCAGTPSTSGTFAVLDHMRVSDKTKISQFRYRGNGWPGEVKADFPDIIQTKGLPRDVIKYDKSLAMTYDNAWGNILNKHVQLRCRLCPDSTGEFADISGGDPWYKQERQSAGVSLILCRTNAGLELIKAAHKDNAISIKKVKPHSLPDAQRNVLNRRCEIYGRLITMKLFNIPIPIYHNIPLKNNWKTLNIKNKLKTVLSTVRRIFIRRWYKIDYY